MARRYLYRFGPSKLKVTSDDPIEDPRYELVDEWDDVTPAPADALEPAPDETDIDEIAAITHAGGGWYDVTIAAGNTVRIQGKAKALAEWRKHGVA